MRLFERFIGIKMNVEELPGMVGQLEVRGEA